MGIVTVLPSDALFIARTLAEFCPSIDDAPALCQADEQTAYAWKQGQIAAKKQIVDAFAAKFHMITMQATFDEEGFRARCMYQKYGK